MKKESTFIISILLALLILVPNHLNHSFGDSIFYGLGNSPLAGEGQTGFNIESEFLGIQKIGTGLGGSVPVGAEIEVGGIKKRYPQY